MFPSYLQPDSMDCGPACLRIISKFYGKNYSMLTLRDRCYMSREGVSLLDLSDAAESLGFRTTGISTTWEVFRDEVPLRASSTGTANTTSSSIKSANAAASGGSTFRIQPWDC